MIDKRKILSKNNIILISVISIVIIVKVIFLKYENDLVEVAREYIELSNKNDNTNIEHLITKDFKLDSKVKVILDNARSSTIYGLESSYYSNINEVKLENAYLVLSVDTDYKSGIVLKFYFRKREGAWIISSIDWNEEIQ